MCYSGIFCKEKLDANHLGIKGFINCQLNVIHDRLNEISTVRTRSIEFQISVERRLHELPSFRRRPSRELKKRFYERKNAQLTPEPARCANINFFLPANFYNWSDGLRRKEGLLVVKVGSFRLEVTSNLAGKSKAWSGINFNAGNFRR